IKPKNRVSDDIIFSRREVGVPLIPLKGIAYLNTNFQILQSSLLRNCFCKLKITATGYYTTFYFQSS
ncbi:MAG: hypothetical protein ACTSSA_05900, partial [Candidatus Freyarchaeota archaeon]